MVAAQVSKSMKTCAKSIRETSDVSQDRVHEPVARPDPHTNMKHSVRVHSLLTAVAALLVSGCFTADGVRIQVHHDAADNLDSIIDSIVNDKNTWVDPAHLF